MNLRQATLQDIPALLALGREFHAALDGAEPLSEDKAETLLRYLIDVPEGFLVVAEDRGVLVGGLAAALWHPLFSSAKQAAELGWWIAPGSRGGVAAPRMLRELETWARALGCTSLVVSSLIHLKGDAVRRMYERAGYVAREMRFSKDLLCQS